MVEQVLLGVIVKDWSLPWFTETMPFGLIVPPAPAVAVIEKAVVATTAAQVVPTRMPSTRTVGAAVAVPCRTETAPILETSVPAPPGLVWVRSGAGSAPPGTGLTNRLTKSLFVAPGTKVYFTTTR